jgi:hypothetical protein
MMATPREEEEVTKIEPVEATQARPRLHPMPEGWKEEGGHLMRRVVSAKGKPDWVPVCYPAIWVKGRAVSLESGDHFVTLAYGSQRAEGEEVPAAEACQARTLVGWRRKGLPVSSNSAKVLVDYIDGALAIMAADEVEAEAERRAPRWPTAALASTTGWLPDGSAFVRGFDEVHFTPGAKRAGLRIVREELQLGFPHGLYPVKMYALQPAAWAAQQQ